MKEKTFRDIFCEHFWITTSGFLSDTARVCSMIEIGIDRILSSVDYPLAENLVGTQWLRTLPLGAEDTEKLLKGDGRPPQRLCPIPSVINGNPLSNAAPGTRIPM